MLDKAAIIADEIAKVTDEVVLFHSASGKDSIALLDILAPRFKRIVCVFMYIVKDLEHNSRYINYARRKYPNCEFVQVPHFAVFSYIKYGYMGHWENPSQKLYSMADLTEIVREKYKIEWACFGFKQSDSLNRRCMLRSYNEYAEKPVGRMEAINDKTKKFYPLSHYKNKDVLEYIEAKGLIRPERFGENIQSNGENITSIDFLLYLKKNFPSDLQKVFAEYPDCERLLFEYDYGLKDSSSQQQ